MLFKLLVFGIKKNPGRVYNVCYGTRKTTQPIAYKTTTHIHHNGFIVIIYAIQFKLFVGKDYGRLFLLYR